MAELKIWWLWRLKPHPKKMIAEVKLPIGYLNEGREHLHAARIRALPGELEAIEQAMKERGLPTSGDVWDAPIGGMRALRIDIHSWSRAAPGGILTRSSGAKKQFWLTPPVYQFLDAKKHLSDDALREVGSPLDRERGYKYWVNQEVFEATGEFLSGGLDKTHRVVNVKDTQHVIHLLNQDMHSTDDDAALANLILVALDAFIERGAPDPRFNPRGNSAPPALGHGLLDNQEYVVVRINRDNSDTYSTLIAGDFEDALDRTIENAMPDAGSVIEWCRRRARDEGSARIGFPTGQTWVPVT